MMKIAKSAPTSLETANAVRRAATAASTVLTVSTVLVVLAGLTIAPASARSVDSAPVRMVEVQGEGRSFWPGWRGPTRQGIVHGSGYVDRWGPDENVLWKTEIPGSGNSSPIVWGDRVYITTAYDGGKTRALLAFDRQTGTKTWERRFADSSPEKVYPKNGFASGTPATDGERIYLYFGGIGVIAVDLNGEVAWRTELEEPTAYHGTAGSPLLHDGKVIIYQDQNGDSFIEAFDTESGERVWRTPRNTRVGWGTPIAVRVGSGDSATDQIVVSSQQFVTAYDAKTGAEVWTAGGNLFEVIPTPVVAHDLIFASSGRAGPTLAIRAGGTGNVTDTHIAWTSPKGSPFVPSGVVVGDNLYLVNDMVSIASAFRAKTGESLWQGRLGKAARESFSASPVAVDGKIFFTNDDGDVFVLEAGDEFKLLHTNSFDERTLASPALVDGVWYWRTAQHLWAIGAAGD